MLVNNVASITGLQIMFHSVIALGNLLIKKTYFAALMSTGGTYVLVFLVIG